MQLPVYTCGGVGNSDDQARTCPTESYPPFSVPRELTACSRLVLRFRHVHIIAIGTGLLKVGPHTGQSSPLTAVVFLKTLIFHGFASSAVLTRTSLCKLMMFQLLKQICPK